MISPRQWLRRHEELHAQFAELRADKPKSNYFDTLRTRYGLVYKNFNVYDRDSNLLGTVNAASTYNALEGAREQYGSVWFVTRYIVG